MTSQTVGRSRRTRPPAGRRGRAAALGAALALVATAASCTGDDPAPEASSSRPTTLVALGDSYSVGYRPENGNTATMVSTDDNFPNDVAATLSTDGRSVDVANFGCAGATSGDLLEKRGCDEGRRAPDGIAYADTTQLEAAEAYLQAHRGEIEAVTLVIGGNDLTSCFDLSGGTLSNDPAPCLQKNLQDLATHLDEILPRLRTAAGPDVPIVGITYPDVFLGLWVRGGAGGPTLAEQSVALFREQLNPILEARYATIGARFVDLTDEFGADVPLTRTTATQSYGTVPEAVAQVCEFTYACSAGDTHPTAEGHEKIAGFVVEALRSPASGGPSVDTPSGTPTS